MSQREVNWVEPLLWTTPDGIRRDEQAPQPPKYDGDCGYDLVCSERVVVRPGAFADVMTGLQLQLPRGTWGMVTGRSSTLRRRGLMVTQGIIDNGYRGDVFCGVWNLTEMLAVVEPGERLAQLILFPLTVPPVAWCEHLDDSARGEAAFGSTGS